MDNSVSFYFAKGLAPSTHKAYTSAQNRYLHFCSANNLQPLPLSETSLSQFVTGLANSSLKHQTIKCYLSGVRHLQISAGLPDPFTLPMPHLKLVLRGIKRHQSQIASTTKARLPITPHILRSLKEYWSANNQGDDTLMIWAACCLCFFGFLRAGEICTPSNAKFDPGCHLSPADISIDDLSHPSILRICIKQSKTDPFRKGVHIIVGATGDCLCPVAAVLQYLAIRGKEPGPLFRFSNGSALTRQNFVSSVRRALSGIGLQTSLYSGHSFRIGAATTAAAQGISDALIKTMGRWESIAYTTYIQTPIDQIAAVSRRLL